MKPQNDPRVCNVKFVDINLFARRFAQQFDFPRSPGYARCLVNAAVRRESLESVYNNHEGLPPDSFFHFFHYSMDEVIEASDHFFACQARLLDLEGCAVAVDLNDVEYWGEEDEYVHPKKGVTKNTYALRYATVSFVDEKQRLTLACLPVSTNDRLADIVTALLEKAKMLVRVDTVLLDRGFYSAGVLKVVEELGIDYVIPLRKGDKADRVWEDAKKDGRFKQRFTLKGPDDEVHMWLYLDRDEKQGGEHAGKRGAKKKGRRKGKKRQREYVGVLSSVDVCLETVQDFMDWYFVRNNVEVGYKEKNFYKIITCSTDKPFRFLVYCICHYLMNLVQVVRRVNNTFFRNNEMKKLVKKLLGQEPPLTGEHKLTRTLIVVA